MADDKSNPSRIKWEGDSRETLRSWPEDARYNIGGDLQRLEDHEKPLDSKPLGDGISELRDRQKNVWYRVLYWLKNEWIYILHAFEKKTNQTPKSDLDLAKARRTKVIQRNDPPYEEPAKEEESA